MLDTVFLEVLNMSKTAAMVIPVVLLARVLLKKAPKAFSYVLWSVVLLRLLCPVWLESPASILPRTDSVSQGYTLSEKSISVTGAAEAAYQAVGDALNGGLGIQHIRTTEHDGLGTTRYVTSSWQEVWLLVGQYIWAVGAVGMLLCSACSYARIRKKLAVVVPLGENIYLADDIHSPFVMGLLRPKIYLPCGLAPREREYIILHEQHHIKRRDPLFKALAFLALTIHWFNPLVWIAFILAGRDMEMSCDEAVICKIGPDIRADYAASLLTLATGRRIIAGTPLAFGEGDPKGRIRNLSRWRKPVLWIAVAAGILCTVLGACLLTDPVSTRETMTWAQTLSAEDVARADLVISTQTPDKQFKRLTEEEIAQMAALISQSRGSYQAQPEQLAGGGIFFYLTMTDGSTHTVGNNGNVYLVIDGEHYEAPYSWLSTWENSFSEGNEPIPEQYFTRQLTLEDVLELAGKGEDLVWGDLNDFSYEETGFGLYIRAYQIDDDFYLMAGGRHPSQELKPMYIRLVSKADPDLYIDIRRENVPEFIQAHSAGADSALWSGDLIPGTAYVSYQYLYLNPLSSYFAFAGACSPT